MDATANIGENSSTAAILDALDVAAILIDLDGVVTHLNEQAALILGIDRERILGRSFFDLESNNTHYVHVRAALQRALGYPKGEQQAEVRSEEHTSELQ